MSRKPVVVAKSGRSIPQQVINKESGPDGDVARFVFLFLPWGNASFLMAIVTVFAWIATMAGRLATHHS